MVRAIRRQGLLKWKCAKCFARSGEGKQAKATRKMWLIETKGWEKEDTLLKDARANKWCKDASAYFKSWSLNTW
ncbi:MAG TPA: hypothetical protein DD719_03470 [Desulfotomaculum sp.]|jgi:hypothetical protein|nr:hypothetical protein [Desulfotomaculum sp.]HCJ78744.1 hypothetical protein [Desulfotomaculum sp.]